MALICDRNTTTKQETYYVVVQKAKRQHTSILDRWQRDKNYKESQLVHEWSDAWVRFLDHVAKIDISHTAPHSQREIYKSTSLAECQQR